MEYKFFASSFIRIAFATLFTQGCSSVPADPVDLTIVNANVYAGPEEAPLEGVNISISDGRIAAIYAGKPLSSDLIIDADGRAVTAGLWNSHVHFTDPRVTLASESVLRDMLLRYGFTTVIDTGSEIEATLALRKKIDQGEVPGPRILMASGSFVYTDGTPSYLPDMRLPEIARPEDAESEVAAVLATGADGIKIFSGSFQGPERTVHLPPPVIRAIADAAHARQSFVFSHPTDMIGFMNAVANGVDVLAHLAPQAGPLGPDALASMIANDVAIIPTLTLWRIELERAGMGKENAMAFQNIAVRQLAEVHDANGQIIFGTDVGYIDDFDTAEEFRLMAAAGMSFDDILASLTTIPSERFLRESGRLVADAAADIVIYKSDPADDATAFSQVAYTIKAGEVVYRADQ